MKIQLHIYNKTLLTLPFCGGIIYKNQIEGVFSMKKQSLYKLALSALFAALVCVMTLLVSIPLPANGYANLGDCFVILSGVVLGPLYGALAAAVGSMLSDVFLGFAVYAPATFVIKGTMALVAALLLSKNKLKGVLSVVKTAVCAVCAELIMVLGYFAFELLLYGLGTATADAIGNSFQGVVGAIAGTAVCSLLSATGVISKIKSLTDGGN